MSQVGTPTITEQNVQYIRPVGIPSAAGVGNPTLPLPESPPTPIYSQYGQVYDWTKRYPKTPTGVVFNNANDVIITEKIDGSESFIEFRIPATDPKRSAIQTGAEIDVPLFPLKRWKIIWYEDDRDSQGTLFTQVHAEALHYEIRGNPVFDIDLVNVTAQVALQAALYGTDWTVGTVAAPQIRGFKVAQSNSLATALQVQKDWGGELWFDERNKIANLTAGDGRSTSVEVSWTKNLAASTRRVDDSNRVDVVVVEGENGIIAGDCSSGCSERGLSSLDSVDVSTAVFVAYLQNRDLNSRAAAANWASMQRSKLCQRLITYHVDYVDLTQLPGFQHELAFLGDVVTVTDAELGVSTRQRIVQWVFNTLEPWKSSYDFTNKVPEFTVPQVVINPLPRDSKARADLIAEDRRLMGVYLGTTQKERRTVPSFDASGCIKTGLDVSFRLKDAGKYAATLGTCSGLNSQLAAITAYASQIYDYFNMLKAFNDCIQETIQYGVRLEELASQGIQSSSQTTVSTNSLDKQVVTNTIMVRLRGPTSSCGLDVTDLANAIINFNSMVPQALQMRGAVLQLGFKVTQLVNHVIQIQTAGVYTDRRIRELLFEAKRDGKVIPEEVIQGVKTVTQAKACFQVCRALVREIQALNNQLQLQQTCITGGPKTGGMTVGSDSVGPGFLNESPQGSGGDGSTADDPLGDVQFGDLAPDASTADTSQAADKNSSTADSQTGSAGDVFNPSATPDASYNPETNPDTGVLENLPDAITPDSAMGQMFSRINDMAQALRGNNSGSSCFQECCDVIVTSFPPAGGNTNSLGKTPTYVSSLSDAFAWVKGQPEGTSVTICITAGHYSVSDLSGLTGWSGNLTIVGVGVGD